MCGDMFVRMFFSASRAVSAFAVDIPIQAREGQPAKSEYA
jgi:hypothetical protein